VTARDRIVVLVLVGAGLLAGFWFGVLSPKRKDAKALNTKIAAQRETLQQAQSALAQATAAKRRYAADYAAVAKLGEAVPVDANVPSLVYQLDAAAGKAKVDFRSLKLNASATPTQSNSTIAGQAAAINQANGNSSSSSSSSTSGGSGQSGSASSAGAGSASSSAPASPAPATQAAAAVLPPGASVGPAGFPTMPFSFVFDGTFFDMEHFLQNVGGFATAQGKTINVNGRLLTIDGISLQASRHGFPRVKATLTATAYLLPSDEGLTNGATPQSPTAATGSQSGGTQSTTPPAATVTGVAR
jgi:type II secretory pathway component PulM